MNAEIMTAIAAGITAIAGAVAWGIRKVFLTLSEYLRELKPNGGGSLKDQVNRLEQRVDDIYKIIAKGK